jgi:hypothetical protein
MRDRVVAVRLLEVARAGTDIVTNEKGMRAEDSSFAALLLLEALDDEPIDALLEDVKRAVQFTEPPTRYDQIFALRRGELA